MIIHDPHLLPSMANEKLEENNRFKKHLKNYKSEELDQQILLIETEIEKIIDCTQCANCCKKLEAGLAPNEIDRLSNYKNCSAEHFLTTFTATEESTNIIYLNKTPCTFLAENRCAIYSGKPAACSAYPSLSGANFKYRLRSVFANYSICPIVYNSIEKLKTSLHFEVNNLK